MPRPRVTVKRRGEAGNGHVESFKNCDCSAKFKFCKPELRMCSYSNIARPQRDALDRHEPGYHYHVQLSEGLDE